MKKIFRKAITVLGTGLLIGSTAGIAAAAAYPSPFTSNTAVVYGYDADASDSIAAGNIVSNLDANAAGSSTTTITGESADLASGSDLLYLNDEFSENIQTLTKSDLPTVLADEVFTDNDGTNYDFEQKLVIGTSTNNGFEFGNSDNDLDDPALMLKLSTTATATNAIYDLTATFNSAVNFTASDSEGEDITIFGRTYTVATATDDNTLVLLGGSGSSNINVGETKNIAVGSESYTVTLDGLSSASTTQASVTVNGETKTFTEGQTKTLAGLDVYVKTVFRTGDDGSGYAEVQLGADKLTLESGNAVQTGSDTDDIDGTLVTFTPSSATGVQALTEIKITVAAEDNDANHLLNGESFVDPVFGTVVVNFDSVQNGPTFSGEKDTGRTDLEIQKGGNRELHLSLTDNAGDSATLPFTYNTGLSDDNSNNISVVEGESISDDGMFILNSGNNQHFMQITKLNLDDGANSDVAMKDLISGETYTFDDHNFASGYSATISGQTYTITNDSATTVTVVSSDFTTSAVTDGTVVSVYPYLELVSGEDTRVAMTDYVLVLDDIQTGSTGVNVTLDLPTGSIDITQNATNDSLQLGSTGVVITENKTVKVGSAYYDFVVSDGTGLGNVDVRIGMDDGQSSAGNAAAGTITTAGILFVEDEDKSESTTTTKNAFVVTTTDTGSYSTVSAPVFTGTSDTETWDNTDFTGWLTNYGTYVWRDTGDSNQNFVGLSYGNEIMSADVTFAEGEVSPTGSAGILSVMDTDVASVAGMNLVVVGGSAINSVAAELLGGAYGGDMFTSMTGVSAGGFLIESFARSGKTALLVAGYNAADTTKATTYLTNNMDKVDTTVGNKYTGNTATSATLTVD